MEKTLKEIADELCIDKQKVYRFVKKECINEAHQNHINEAVNEALISMLQRELEIKNKQIEDLNARLAESNAALVAAQQTAQAAQALHAGTIRQQLTDGGADPAEPEAQPQKKRWRFWK